MKIISKNLLADSEKINIRSICSPSELQKELIISELETKLKNQEEKSVMLENKLFSLEKTIFVLQSSKNDNDICSLESPPKQPRIEQDKDEFINRTNNGDQEILIKYNIISAELDELKKISKNHLIELESFYADNIKLKEELEIKRDQVNQKIHAL